MSVSLKLKFNEIILKHIIWYNDNKLQLCINNKKR